MDDLSSATIFQKGISEIKTGVILSIIVRPRSKTSGLVKFDNWRTSFEVKVRSAPLQGQANLEVIDIFSDLFGIPRKNIEVISGQKSTQKKVLLKNIQVNKVISVLEQRLK